MVETTQFLSELRAERASKAVDSEESQTPVPEEDTTPASEEANTDTPASKEVHTPASEEASPSDQRVVNDDTLSILGGDDFDDNEDLLDEIVKSLRPSDSIGPPIHQKIAKTVNNKFSSDPGLEKRKEKFEKYKTPEKCPKLFVPKSQWEGLTSDRSILQTVKGEVIEFIGDPPTCSNYPTNSISKDHEIKMDEEISKLLAKNVIVKTFREPGEFISPIFSVPKKDDKVRLILNLKIFNEHVKSYHFKMDSINTALSLMTKECWLASLDLKDAYYTVDVSANSEASLTGWGGVLDSCSMGGSWTAVEAQQHINYLELLAAFFTLKSFINHLRNKHVKIMIDNTTAVSVINNKGTNHSEQCNELHSESTQENNSRQSHGHSCGPRLANTELVSPPTSISSEAPTSSIAQSRPLSLTIRLGPQTSSPQELEHSYLSCIRNKLQVRGFATDTIDIILSSWREGTKTQYQSTAKKWFDFCQKNNCDIISPSLPQALLFLSDLFKS
ncbi:Pol poly, partial [Paramuricea clavata]